jgi:hypothetical protein
MPGYMIGDLHGAELDPIRMVRERQKRRYAGSSLEHGEAAKKKQRTEESLHHASGEHCP